MIFTGFMVITKTYNIHCHRQNIRKKKIKKHWATPENFDISLSVRLDRYCKKLISGGKIGGTLGCAQI